MSLIEGIGDEVTILVTVIVAVTTVVAAWFSTSVTEQQPYWQDEPSPGSPVDPEPPSQQSTTYSEDGIGDVISEAAETHERLNLGNLSGELSSSVPETINRTIPSSETDLGTEGPAVIVAEKVTASSSSNTEAVLKSEAFRYEEGTKQNTASQNSSFECLEATNDVNESSTLKTSGDCPDFDMTDGVSSYEEPPSDIVEERVEDVNIHSEEQSVRRRHVPSTAPEKSESQTKLDQSQSPSQTETNRDSQSDQVSQENVRRESQPQLTRDQAASGVITIKLRFLDETERVVSTNMADTLGNFRRETFSSEMQSGKTVRLISNGQLLSEDSRTLASYGITNQQVIHCQISQASPRNQQGQQHLETGDGEFDLGRYMVPLFACILAFMWYLRFQYRYMFNATSTLSLTAVTAVFLLALLAVWRA